MHAPFSLADWQVRILSSIVTSPTSDVIAFHPEDLKRCSIRGQLVRHHLGRHEALCLEELAQQLVRSLLVTSRLHQDIQHFAFAINGPPQIHRLAIDRDEHLIEMPAHVGRRM